MIAGNVSRPWPEAPTIGDVILIVAALAAAVMLAFGGTNAAAPQRALVDVDGQILHDVALDGEQTLVVTGPLGTSVILIRDGQARIASAPCSGQFCVARGWLRKSGDIAACVPNRTVLRLTGGAPRILDGVTR
ncbi:MAG: NusG domain II-containing protein [bacterium]|nr:NusG domain II-containing protein [bacterium]